MKWDEITWEKAKRKITGLLVSKMYNTVFQFKIYPSYWHYRLTGNKSRPAATIDTHYLFAKPNYGAGIGHQLANWNAGLYFAGLFGLQFVHFPFSSNLWESSLGLGEDLITVNELKKKKFKRIRLPKFDSKDPAQIALIKNIIESYRKENLMFSLEMDQGYWRQFETFPILREKFFKSRSRKNDHLMYSATSFNIAIHVRRGDITEMRNSDTSSWKDRWLDNSYYVTVLRALLTELKFQKEVDLYIFSQGHEDDFSEFKEFENVNYKLNVNAIDSFVHMVYADVLITSKSSFSYKPALISRGIKICPRSFWHEYPQTADYILADDRGIFDMQGLRELRKLFTENAN
jgi:hypothetical protein